MPKEGTQRDVLSKFECGLCAVVHKGVDSIAMKKEWTERNKHTARQTLIVKSK